MYKLVILVVDSRLIEDRRPDMEKQLPEEDGFETQAQAELRALLWLTYCPDDIVMLVDLAEDICAICELPIEERPGAIIHKWVHTHGKLFTWPKPYLHQATPIVKENE